MEKNKLKGPGANRNRIARAQIGKNGYLVFHLLQGVQPRTVKMLGYSKQHRLWVRFLDLNQSKLTLAHESASIAKAMIADWVR